MNYLSLFSGIGAETLAWESLGWKPLAFAEIEPFPSAVLNYHYPETPKLGDATKFKEWPDYEDIEFICGGTPCQSFSVAGLRNGLADPRGNLALVYLAVIDRYRPRWVVWENVPGILSSNKGRDFGTFLGALGQLGYGWAYRVLDAQYFGVPQRRRRVFLVGYRGDWRPPAAVLLERQSLCGHPPPSGEKREKVARTTTPSLTGSGRGVKRVGESRGQDMVIVPDISPPLDTRAYDGQRTNQGGVFIRAHGQSNAEICKNGVAHSMTVRRLTPRECERLQGFPDDYTKIPYRGKEIEQCPDGPRYTALGNSMAVPVVRWIGKRIVDYERRVRNDKAITDIA